MSRLRLVVFLVVAGVSLSLQAAERPQRAVVRTMKGAILEYLTESIGGGYVRRAAGGEWLGRASLLGDTYRFYDKVGRTVWTARPELQPLGTTRRALATVRDMGGRIIGMITAQ